MKNKKLIIISISLIVIGLIVIAFGFLNGSSLTNLKGDSSQIVSGVAIETECQKNTLAANESTDCAVYVNAGTNRVFAVIGRLTSSSNLSISRKSYNEDDWDVLSELLAAKDADNLVTGKTKLMDFTITASDTEEAYVIFTGDDDKVTIEINNGSSTETVEEVLIPTFSKIVNEETTPQPSSDATLASAKLGSINMNNGDTITVPFDVSTATLSFTASDSAATIASTFNSNTQTGTGSLSYDISLPNTDTNYTIAVQVTAEDGTTTRNYSYTVVRESKEEVQVALLDSLSVTGYNLNKIFSPTTFEYSLTVPNEVSSIEINASASDGITPQGVGTKNLVVGSNEFVITATKSGYQSTRYTLYVIRENEPTPGQSSDATLGGITVNGTPVDLSTMTITVEYEVEKVTLNVKPHDTENAHVTGKTGEQAISVGKNEFMYIVTAEDGTVKTYTLKVIRKDKEGTVPEDQDETDNCVISSEKYNVDNNKHTIGGVPLDESNEKVKENLTSNCGNITVENDKVTLKYGSNVIEYIIVRAWKPNTGNIQIKYSYIIGGIIVLIGIALLLKNTVFKKEK